MSKLEKVLYTARVHATGGWEGGGSRSDDGRLQITLSTPGASDTGASPEQLFGAAWSPCILSTIELVAGKRSFAIPNNAAINAGFGLGLVDGAYHLD